MTLSTSPCGTGWCKRKSSDDLQATTTNQDTTGTAKILTLNKRYALGRVGLSSFYTSRWLPPVLGVPSIVTKDGPQLSVNCEVIETGEICDDCDQVHGLEAEHGRDGPAGTETTTSPVHLVRGPSNSRCTFPSGIRCIARSETNLYSRFERTDYDFGRSDTDALCHYCSAPVPPNLRCGSCTTRCSCSSTSDDPEDSCKNFVCSDYVEVNMINVDTGWTLPVCPNKSRQSTV